VIRKPSSGGGGTGTSQLRGSPRGGDCKVGDKNETPKMLNRFGGVKEASGKGCEKERRKKLLNDFRCSFFGV